jgi:holo-[acyl-carrier protein] synthase
LVRELDEPQRGFVDAVFTPAELAACRGGPRAAHRLAERFAGKEAVLKALAFAHGRGSFWQDVEITRRGEGPAAVRLQGRLEELAARHGAGRIHLSLAAAGDHALAVALIEERGDATPRPDTNHTRD